MDVLFLGSGRFALPQLEALAASPEHRVVAVVSQPDRPRGRGRRTGPTPVAEMCAAKGLHLYRPDDVNDATFQREIRALSPAAVVTSAYGQKLSDELLALPRFCAVNVHPSMLPRYRGAAPIARAILRGETVTGVTIGRMVQRLDAGPIYLQREAPIGPEETTGELEPRLAAIGAELLLQALTAIADGTAKETPQEESRVSFAPRFRKEEGRIRWKRSAPAIHNHVRAFHPSPRAFTRHAGRRIFVHRVRAESGAAEPGTVIAVDDAIHVACGDGAVALLEVQGEGGRRMPAAEFLNGHPIKPGEKVG